jgi:hypothetical protein
VIGLGNSVSFSTEFKERVQLFFYCLSGQLWPLVIGNFTFSVKERETQFVAVCYIHHVQDCCGGNRFADCR